MKHIKLAYILPIALAILTTPVASTFASQGRTTAQDPQAMVCQGLNLVGLPCGSTKPYVSGTYKPLPTHFNFDIFSNTPVSSTSTTSEIPEQKTVIANSVAPRDLSGQKINLVSVPNSEEIYELVNGQKHVFPSLAIFYDYGYKLEMIQPISQYQLDKYPRADLIKVKGSSDVYYLTEGGLVRPVLNTKKIFEFYGDRKEDIITISRKEFNFYPSNQYVYQFSPLNRDVFQISGSGKRYLTPMAVARLGLQADQIAPISKLEMDSYKTLTPLID